MFRSWEVKRTHTHRFLKYRHSHDYMEVNIVDLLRIRWCHNTLRWEGMRLSHYSRNLVWYGKVRQLPLLSYTGRLKQKPLCEVSLTEIWWYWENYNNFLNIKVSYSEIKGATKKPACFSLYVQKDLSLIWVRMLFIP